MTLFQPNLFQTGAIVVPGDIDLAGIMDAIAAAGPIAATGNVFPYPAEAITPPAVIVGYPTTLDFDVTFVRGNARMVFPVWFVVGNVSTLSARDTLSGVIGGAADIKSSIESDIGLHAVVSTVRVTDCAIESISIAGVPYLSARFDVEVYT